MKKINCMVSGVGFCVPAVTCLMVTNPWFALALAAVAGLNLGLLAYYAAQPE